MIRYSVKYLDGIWRSATTTFTRKGGERAYANELAEMFRHFLEHGNILAYTVAIVTINENGEHIEVVATEV